ncbi:MAG TPA: hypothetical protein VEF53_00990 [Patescibacteria group bacterium]|nr:hypothetical protein [Patescibacteria group bacterium]
MLRKKIESFVGIIPEWLFREAMEEATQDIKANRLLCNTKTYIEYLVYVMVTYIRMVQKIEKSQKQIA